MTVVPCAALGYIIERVDMVLVGAEAVAESGGIVNKLGTYPMAMVAKLFNKPVYCAVESYKFARVYPLTQADLPKHKETPLVPPKQLNLMNGMGTTMFPSSDQFDDFIDEKLEDKSEGETSNLEDSTSEENIDSLKPNFVTENPTCDYTPASYLTLLFTDLGVLTPAAVSDELIRLYQ